MIPGIVLPVVLVTTFAGMYLLGYSIDNLSLMGLTIAIGFLVDDAIVMIENIVRHIEAGETPFEAAIHGAGEIGFTIVSITLSLAAVFIPLLFMSGVVGRLFHEFAMTVTLGDLPVRLRVPDADADDVRAVSDARDREPRAASAAGSRAGSTGCAAYDRGLVWVLRHQFFMLLVTLGLTAATVFLYVMIPKGFFPEQDTGFIFGEAQARQDISFAAMAKIENQFAAIILNDPAVVGRCGLRRGDGR